MLDGNADLLRAPDHVTVLDLQHLSEAASGFERADDSVSHRGTGEAMLGAGELVGRSKELLFFVVPNAAITFRLALVLILTPKRWNGDVVKIGGVRPRPQLIACRKMASVRLMESRN